jgi:hypothetical protein
VVGLLQANLLDENRRAQTLPVPPKLRVGERIDGLAVTALVADSGINLLYQVRDPATQKLYALKTLNPARAHDEQERAMLAHEAWLAKRMQSSQAADHLVALHDGPPSGQPPSAFYLVYDWHAGETLQQMLARQQRPGQAQAVSAATQVLKALARLHRQGVIHRDIKPANLHQGEDGVLRLLDLGVALSGNEPEAMRRLHAGTPSYINPEQWGYSAAGRGHRRRGRAARCAKRPVCAGRDAVPAAHRQAALWRRAALPKRALLPRPHSPQPPQPRGADLARPRGAESRGARQNLRFETAEELLLALERGASRPLTAPPVTPLIQRDPTACGSCCWGERAVQPVAGLLVAVFAEVGDG